MMSRQPTASIGKTTFNRKNPLLEKIWKQQRTRKTDEQEEKIQEEVRNCTCYQFDPRCWAKSGNSWETHCKFCRRCRKWGQNDCEVKQHSAERKKELLTEVSQARATLGRIIRNSDGNSCCELKRCTHKFTNHGREKIPWWVCFNLSCEIHHYLAKQKNGIWPIIPTIAIKNAQNCPCFREGCECNWIQYGRMGTVALPWFRFLPSFYYRNTVI